MRVHTESLPIRPFLMRIAIAVSALAISSYFFACTRTDQKPVGPLEKVTIAYAIPPYTALADIAQARGYFRLEGLEVTPRFHSTGKAALDEVLEGKADLATVAETPVMFAIMRGAEISIIATIQSSNKNNAIFARKEKGIRAPQDLKGKKIGVTSGTIGEFFMDAFLAVHGISRKGVTVVNLEPEKMPEALVNGDVDAVSAWSPVLSQAQANLGERGIIFHDEDIFTQTFNIAATQDYIRKNPARVKAVLLALIKAEQFAIHNPAAAQEIVADFQQMDRALFGEIWTGNTFSVTLDQSLLLALEDESRWAIKNGLIGKSEIPNYLDFIYLDGLASVKPKAVRILR